MRNCGICYSEPAINEDALGFAQEKRILSFTFLNLMDKKALKLYCTIKVLKYFSENFTLQIQNYLSFKGIIFNVHNVLVIKNFEEFIAKQFI